MKAINNSIERLSGTVEKFYYQSKRVIILAAVTILTVAPLSFLNQTASAAQVTHRSLTISSAVPGQTGVAYTFAFEPSTTSTIQSMFFQSCTTAVGACTAPTGINMQSGSVSLTGGGFAGTVSALGQNTTDSTPACNLTTNLCANWTDATNQTAGSSLQVFVTGVTNQAASTCSGNANCTFFVRMITYSDNAYTTQVDYGTVASSTSQTYTVNATVEEQLSFCVGSVNGASATVETVTYAVPTCSTLSGTSLSLGTLETGETSVSPIATGQPLNGDNNNGLIELNTNASNGTSISYNAIQQSGTNHDGALRVPGATCSAGNTYTDQCFNSIGSTAAYITAGTENFGMTTTGVNCANVPGGVYTCNATNHNLSANTQYDCNASDNATSFSSFDAGGTTSSATTCKYAWDETGTSEPFASATTVVAGEAMFVEFAATPEITTPTGAYTAEASFVAVPEY